MSDTFVIGVGATSPFGLDARQCALVTRANKLTPRPCELRDARGSRLADVRARSLPEDLYGVERLLALAAPALRETVEDAGLTHGDRPLALYLALPELRPDDEPRFGRAFVEALSSLAKVEIDLSASLFFRAGAVGIAAALDKARSSVADGRAVLVGGVDSYHHPLVLPWLDREKRLLSGTAHDGFIASEGASFAALAGPKHKGPRFAKVVDAGVAQQPDPEPTDVKNGEAFSALARRMGDTHGGRVFRWVLPDVNGERHRVNEWMITKIRNDDLFSPEDTRDERLTDHTGDSGAAWGALALSYLSYAFRLGFAPQDRALVMLSSEGRARGCFLLDRA